MNIRLAEYLETGVLPKGSSNRLTDTQKEAIAHASPAESTGDLAARIGAKFFTVQRYRTCVFAMTWSRLHWRHCAICGELFVSKHAMRKVHEACDTRVRTSRRLYESKAA